jgi:hypothetical protein
VQHVLHALHRPGPALVGGRINGDLDRLARQAMRLLYGGEPTDDELREVLRRLCLRVLRV